MFVKCFKSKVLFKWQVFLSTQSLQITGKIQGMFAHPTENFVTWTESKVFYQLREKSNWNTHYQHPPPSSFQEQIPGFVHNFRRFTGSYYPKSAKYKNPKETFPKLLTTAPRAAAQCLPSPQVKYTCRKLIGWVTIQQKDLGIFYGIDYIKKSL